MSLGFSLKLPVAKMGKKSSKPKIKRDNVLEKDIEGIIVETTDENNKYQVFYDNTFYLIHPDCFNTDKVRKVYAKDDAGRWLMYDRICAEDRRRMPAAYFPFKPKLCVKGKLVEKDYIVHFKIKVVWNKNNVDEYEEAMRQLNSINENDTNN